MSSYNVDLVRLPDRVTIGDIQTEIEHIHQGLNYSDVQINTSQPYTTKTNATENSIYIKDTAISYGVNAISYLAGILPKLPNYLEYAMPEGMTHEQVINALPDTVKYHEPNLVADGYTAFEETGEYKKVSKELYDTFKEMGVNPSPLELATAIPDILDMFSLLSNKFHKEDINPYEEGTLQHKIYKHKKEEGEFNGPFAKLKKFFSKHRFNLNIDFNMIPQLPGTTPTDNDFGINAIMTAANAREQISTVKPEFINFDSDIDTFDYMAGGDMYCSFRKPFVLGQRPELSLETESSIFGGTELLEKRFDLLHKFRDDVNDNIGGTAMYTAMDIIKKNKYLAKISSYNKAVADVNKTNEMLAKFADKLDMLYLAQILGTVGNASFYSNYFYLGGGEYGFITDFIGLVETTMEAIKDNETIDWSLSYLEFDLLINRIITKPVGKDKVNKYATSYILQDSFTDANAYAYAIELTKTGVPYYSHKATLYQNELIAHAEYMDATYGIEV